MLAVAPVDLNSFGNRSQYGFHAAHLRHPLGCGGHGRIIEPGANVGDSAFADLPRNCRRLALDPAVTLSIFLKNFSVAVSRTQPLGPKFALSRAELSVQGNR